MMAIGGTWRRCCAIVGVSDKEWSFPSRAVLVNDSRATRSAFHDAMVNSGFSTTIASKSIRSACSRRGRTCERYWLALGARARAVLKDVPDLPKFPGRKAKHWLRVPRPPQIYLKALNLTAIYSISFNEIPLRRLRRYRIE
jgi:hypothetical protein